MVSASERPSYAAFAHESIRVSARTPRKPVRGAGRCGPRTSGALPVGTTPFPERILLLMLNLEPARLVVEDSTVPWPHP